MYPVDEVDGEKFKNTCDFKFGEKIPKKSVSLMYTASDNHKEVLGFILKHPDSQFKLLTHNSDVEIKECKIPDNLVVWYAQNLGFKHPRVHALPIGLENNHWHPQKRNIMKNAPFLGNRKLRAFTQFNPSTHEERSDLLNKLHLGTVFADYGLSRNGQNFERYVNHLREYAFCLCPRGNGIDTHRIWEALYLGCIPIVKKYITHECLEGLPVLFIEDWNEVTENRLKKEYKNMQAKKYELNKLSFSYWKNKILA